jgi:hypothetical protein
VLNRCATELQLDRPLLSNNSNKILTATNSVHQLGSPSPRMKTTVLAESNFNTIFTTLNEMKKNLNNEADNTLKLTSNPVSCKIM